MGHSAWAKHKAIQNYEKFVRETFQIDTASAPKRRHTLPTYSCLSPGRHTYSEGARLGRSGRTTPSVTAEYVHFMARTVESEGEVVD